MSDLEKAILSGADLTQGKPPEQLTELRKEVIALGETIADEFRLRRDKMKQYKQVCKKYGEQGDAQYAQADAKWKAWKERRSAEVAKVYELSKWLKDHIQANEPKLGKLQAVLLGKTWKRLWIERTDQSTKLWMASPNQERVIFIEEMTGCAADSVLERITEWQREWDAKQDGGADSVAQMMKK